MVGEESVDADDSLADSQADSDVSDSAASIVLRPGPIEQTEKLSKRLARMSVEGPAADNSVADSSVADEISLDEDENEEDTEEESEEEESEEDSEEESEEDEEAEVYDPADESFDVTKASADADSSVELPRSSRRSAAARRSSAAPAAKGARKSAATARQSNVPLKEQAQPADTSAALEDPSDASLIQETNKAPRKKKRVLPRASALRRRLTAALQGAAQEGCARRGCHDGADCR
jgi:hypothetical protein